MEHLEGSTSGKGSGSSTPPIGSYNYDVIITICVGFTFVTVCVYSILPDLFLPFLLTGWGSLGMFGVTVLAENILMKFKFPSIDFPRIWDLFAFLLPRKTREQVYEPYHQELLEDYLLARAKYRTKPTRRWLTFCFTVRSALLVAQCFYLMLGEKGRRLIMVVLLVILGERASQGLMGILQEIIRRL